MSLLIDILLAAGINLIMFSLVNKWRPGQYSLKVWMTGAAIGFIFAKLFLVG